MKTPVLESLFNSEYCEIFKRTYFEEHLRTAASENMLVKLRKIKIDQKTGFLSISLRSKFMMVFNDLFPLKISLVW